MKINSTCQYLLGRISLPISWGCLMVTEYILWNLITIFLAPKNKNTSYIPTTLYCSDFFTHLLQFLTDVLLLSAAKIVILFKIFCYFLNLFLNIQAYKDWEKQRKKPIFLCIYNFCTWVLFMSSEMILWDVIWRW